MRKRLRWLVLGVAIIVAVASAMPSASAAAKKAKIKAGGSVLFLTSSEPPNFDPAKVAVSGSSSGIYGAAVYDNLWWIDVPTQKVIPRFAESVKSNADATVWTIKLRKGLMFTDNTVFDAAAIKAFWDRIKDPATGSTCQTVIAGLTSYVVTDPLTLTITLPEGRAGLPQQLACALGIPSPTAVAKYGATFGSSPETTVGAGAYILKELVRGDHYTMVRNPNFWDAPRPYLDQITFKAAPDTGTAVNALLAGTAQIVNMPTITPDTKRALDAGLKDYFIPRPGALLVKFNTKRPPFDDARVREALILATVPDELNAKAAAGSAIMADTFYDKDSAYYCGCDAQATNNLAKAQKLIDAYVAEKGPITGKLLTATSFQLWFTALQQQWARLKGVDIQLDPVTGTVAGVRLRAGDFDIGPATVDGTNAEGFYNEWFSTSTLNVLHFSDPTLDKLITDARPLTGSAQKAAFNKISKRLIENHWFYMMYRQQVDTFVTSNVSVQGMHDDSMIDFTTVSLKQS